MLIQEEPDLFERYRLSQMSESQAVSFFDNTACEILKHDISRPDYPSQLVNIVAAPNINEDTIGPDCHETCQIQGRVCQDWMGIFAHFATQVRVCLKHIYFR